MNRRSGLAAEPRHGAGEGLAAAVGVDQQPVVLVDHDVGRGAAVVGDHRYAAGQRLVHRRRVDLALARLDAARRRWRCSVARSRPVACGITLAPAARSILAPGPSPSTTSRTPGSWAIVASRLSTFLLLERAPTWPTTSWPPSGEWTRAQRSWRSWSRSPGWWSSRSTPGFQVRGSQHDGRHAEPVGRLGGLDAEPVRVDQVADVGTGERHRLADGRPSVIRLAQKMPGTVEARLAATARRSTVTSWPPSVRRPTISRVTRAAAARRWERTAR